MREREGVKGIREKERVEGIRERVKVGERVIVCERREGKGRERR
jgi:hypothetical protein